MRMWNAEEYTHLPPLLQLSVLGAPHKHPRNFATRQDPLRFFSVPWHYISWRDSF